MNCKTQKILVLTLALNLVTFIAQAGPPVEPATAAVVSPIIDSDFDSNNEAEYLLYSRVNEFQKKFTDKRSDAKVLEATIEDLKKEMEAIEKQSEEKKTAMKEEKKSIFKNFFKFKKDENVEVSKEDVQALKESREKDKEALAAKKQKLKELERQLDKMNDEVSPKEYAKAMDAFKKEAKTNAKHEKNKALANNGDGPAFKPSQKLQAALQDSESKMGLKENAAPKKEEVAPVLVEKTVTENTVTENTELKQPVPVADAAVKLQAIEVAAIKLKEKVTDKPKTETTQVKKVETKKEDILASSVANNAGLSDRQKLLNACKSIKETCANKGAKTSATEQITKLVPKTLTGTEKTAVLVQINHHSLLRTSENYFTHSVQTLTHPETHQPYDLKNEQDVKQLRNTLCDYLKQADEKGEPCLDMSNVKVIAQAIENVKKKNVRHFDKAIMESFVKKVGPEAHKLHIHDLEKASESITYRAKFRDNGQGGKMPEDFENNKSFGEKVRRDPASVTAVLNGIENAEFSNRVCKEVESSLNPGAKKSLHERTHELPGVDQGLLKP